MSLRRRTARTPQLLLAAALSGVLLAPPAAAVTTPRPSPGGGVPLRVATYNIHAGASRTACSTWTGRWPNCVHSTLM